MGFDDDALKRFEERNKDALAVEAKKRMMDRIIVFTKVDVMNVMIGMAVARTAIACRVPPQMVRGSIVIDPDTGRARPAIEVAYVQGIVVDEEKLRAVFQFAIKQVMREWHRDVVDSSADEAFFSEVRARIQRSGETTEQGLERLRAWAA